MGSIDGAVRSKFSEKVVLEVVEGTVKMGCLVVDIGEDGTFGTFAENEGGWESDFLAEAEGGVVFTEDTEYAV